MEEFFVDRVLTLFQAKREGARTEAMLTWLVDYVAHMYFLTCTEREEVQHAAFVLARMQGLFSTMPARSA